jgi:hypothetical protein
LGYVSFGWTGENREIEVVLKDGTWMTVHYVDGEPDPHFSKIFGSNELETPWTDETDKDTVIKELADRNPHAVIS